MSFRNEAVFTYPAVQYIPLTVTNISHGDLNTGAMNLHAQLIVGDDLYKWRSLLTQDYRIALPDKFREDSLPLLALNLKIGTVKYRGYFITMTGQKKHGYYQVFSLPKRYFYKNNLYFEVFDELTGDRLTRCSLFMPNIKLHSKMYE